jgi:hypothetical protein
MMFFLTGIESDGAIMGPVVKLTYRA